MARSEESYSEAANTLLVSCPLCRCTDYKVVLDKPPVHIWDDEPDGEGVPDRFRCMLHQCVRCRHVYEPVDETLLDLFRRIYESPHAQGPSAMGHGKWGMDRASAAFLDTVDTHRYQSALEIGCGDGFLLRELKKRGYKRLLGIEPSTTAQEAVGDGIEILNQFVDTRAKLAEPFDLIFAIAVFEHLPDVIRMMDFCRRNISANGTIYVAVPNAEIALANADPGLFTHQHLHCFTAPVLRNLFGGARFRVTSLESTPDALKVFAAPHDGQGSPQETGPSFSDYQPRLDAVLARLTRRLTGNRTIVHGACNALNNITGWIDGRFVLADNDENRQGKTYFGRRVHAVADLDLSAFDTVMIVPLAYVEAITEGYRSHGFRGDVVTVADYAKAAGTHLDRKG